MDKAADSDEVPPRVIDEQSLPVHREWRPAPVLVGVAMVLIIVGVAGLWSVAHGRTRLEFESPASFECGKTLSWTEDLADWQPVLPDRCVQGDTYEVRGRVLSQKRGMHVKGWIGVPEQRAYWPALENDIGTWVGSEVEPRDGSFTLHFCLGPKSERREFLFILMDEDGESAVSSCNVPIASKYPDD